MKKHFILMVLCLAILSPSYASDHIDTPSIDDLAAADLTDMFAFSRKSGDKNTLVLAMTTHLFAKKKTKFSDRVEYSFQLRRANIIGSGPNFGIDTRDEHTISCTFQKGSDGKQVMQCTVSQAEFGRELVKTEVKVGDLNGGNNESIRVFAGLRADPFFFDLVRVGLERKRNTSFNDKGFPFPGIIPKNGLIWANVLAIVVELDVDRILGPSDTSLFAVASHTKMTTDHHGEEVVFNIDRMGRPEITNFVMGKFSTSDKATNQVKKQWNAEASSFVLDRSKAGLYRKTIEAGLEHLDMRDQGKDWPSPHPFTRVIMDDFLLVDLSKPGNATSTNTYLEIEKSLFADKPHQTCGGRTINDDFVDIMLTYFINGPDRKTPERGDGIDKQSRQGTNVFPYLGKP